MLRIQGPLPSPCLGFGAKCGSSRHAISVLSTYKGVEGGLPNRSWVHVPSYERELRCYGTIWEYPNVSGFLREHPKGTALRRGGRLEWRLPGDYPVG